LLILLDILPWPWGEDILAGLFMLVGLAQPSRRRAAVVLARAGASARPWRLAAAICAFRGRWVARAQLLGVRSPAQLRHRLVIEGAEHLDSIRGPAILLGFHLGPPCGEAIFRLLGYPVTYVGWHDRDVSMGWWSEEWRPFAASTPLSRAAGDSGNWAAVLYHARRVLLDGGKIHIRVDGEGREAFRLPLRVGPWSIAGGWLALHQLTGASVLPVVHHLDGRQHIITIRPPLPTSESDPQKRLAGWLDLLTRLFDDFVERFPAQCPHLAMLMDKPGVARTIG